jgi:hypothetical protein
LSPSHASSPKAFFTDRLKYDLEPGIHLSFFHNIPHHCACYQRHQFYHRIMPKLRVCISFKYLLTIPDGLSCYTSSRDISDMWQEKSIQARFMLWSTLLESTVSTVIFKSQVKGRQLWDIMEEVKCQLTGDRLSGYRSQRVHLKRVRELDM